MKTINLILILGIITILLFSFGCTNTNVFDEYNYGIDNNQGFEDINNNSNELMTCSALGGIICNQGEECSTYILSSSEGGSCCIQGECIGEETTCGNGVCEEGEGIFNCLSDCENDANQVPVNNVSPPSQPPTEIPDFEPNGSPADGMFIYSAGKFSENNKIFVWSDIFKGVNGNRTIPLHSLYSTAGDWIYNYSNKAWLYSEDFSDIFKIEGTYYAKANQWYFYGNGWAEVTNLEVYTLQNCGNSNCEADLGENKDVCPKDCGSDTLNCSQINGTACSENQTCTTHTVTTKNTQNCCIEGNCEDEQVIIPITQSKCITITNSGNTIRVNDSSGKSLFPYNLSANMLFVNTELAPIIKDNRMFITTGWTYSFPYVSGSNFITNFTGFKQDSLSNPRLILGGKKYVNDSDINNPQRQSPFPLSDSQLDSKNPFFWSKNYYGVYSVEKINNELIFFTHGENKNEYENNVCYQNNIDSSVFCSECRSGAENGEEYSDCGRAYASFLGMGHSPTSSGAGFIDEGPVIWPTTGYSQSNTLTQVGSLGMASHVDSIIKDNYIYLFYYGSGSGTSSDARNYGIKVARAPISGGGKPGTFKTWYKLPDGTEGWEDSLPAEWYSNGVYVKDTGKTIYSDSFKGEIAQGWVKLNGEDWYNFGNGWMQKEKTGNDLWWNYGNGWMTRETKGFRGFNELDSYDINGGRASNILGETEDTEQLWWWPRACNDNNLIPIGTIEFSVAKLKGTDYYIGVETGGGWKITSGNWPIINWVGLRISKDLIHWSDLYVIKDTIQDTWQSLKLAHTKFLSSDFKSNKEVDPKGFYLIGSHGNGTTPCSSVGCWQQLNYKYLEISLPTEICNNKDDDLDGQLDEGCDDDYDHYADASMTCENNFWSLEYNGDTTHSNEWYNEWFYYENGWRGKLFSCLTNSGDTDDTNPNIYPGTQTNCTSFTYSDWGECQDNNTKTRTVTSSSPSGCTGGNPVLTQSCVYVTPCVTGTWTNTSNYRCASGVRERQQTRTASPASCDTNSQWISYPCTSGKICTGNGNCVAPTCTSFTYSSWAPTVCPQSEVQTRTVTSSSPSGCQGGNPVLTKTCTYVPPEICDGIDNNSDGQTDEGCDDDLDGYADASMQCPSDKEFIVYKYSDDYKTTCPTNDWCLMGNENWWSWGNGWIGLNDEVWFHYENGWISRNIPCSTNSGDIDDTNPLVH